MTDQQRWDTLGAYGNSYIQTPNLDRLAHEGALFEQAFVPVPLCTPSRASIFTSQYPSRHGLRANVTFPLPPSTPNLVDTLRTGGYRTMLVGKDHLFGRDGAAQLFDRVVPYDHAGRVGDEPTDVNERTIRAFRQGRAREKFVDRDEYAAVDTPTSRLTTEAIDAARWARTQDQPFFLWLSYPDPHPPYVVAEPYASMYRGKDIGRFASRVGELGDKPLRQRLAQDLMKMEDYSPEDVQRVREIYFGMVSFIDDEVGRFLRALEHEQSNDTIIVFMSDHGDYMGDHGMLRKSPSMYDCLVRIPFILHWRGHISPARIHNTLVESIDLAPTLLELAGLPPLPNSEGTSLVPLLQGHTDHHKDRVFGLYGVEGSALTERGLQNIDFEALTQNPYPGGNWVSPLTMRGRMAMVRTAEWKLVHYRSDQGEGELYDLGQDPNELVNRYNHPSYAAVRATLTHSLADFLLDTISEEPNYDVPDPPLLS